MSEQNEKITLIDEEGIEHNFTVIDFVEIEDRSYAVLLPEVDPEAGAVIFKIELDENGEEILLDIEDDEEFEEVVRVLEGDDEE
ncbi:MAG: DUF1292 domain-containing protein [Firmicutes bacterium]|nr:DUF1292 domain-containing protein [Bacillota bacterium]